MATGRDYQRKGDPFTLRVERGEGPRCAIQWAKQSTGRVYFTRVPVHRCYRLDAVKVAEGMRGHIEQLSERLGKPVTAAWLAEHLWCDWHPAGHRIRLRLNTEPRELQAEVRLKV